MTPDNDYSNTPDLAPNWDLQRCTSVPDPVPGYVERPALIERLMVRERPIAVLRAPGGFGKTALLAAYCRYLIQRGVPAAWLRLDGACTQSVIEDCIAVALRGAGVTVPTPSPRSRNNAEDRVGPLLSALAAHPDPCALALDNLEQLTDPDDIRALNRLLSGAPPNLSVTLACRELPPALGLAELLLEGQLTILGADQLRFSPREAALFLGRRPTRLELDTVEREFAGWPVALALYRNVDRGHTGEGIDSARLLDTWIESRLWERLSTDQRDFLLDAGLMDRLDPVLLDEVMERSDSLYRLQVMPELDGLVRPCSGGGFGAVALHPLLRRHCAARRFRETPERFQAIHRRAALALERRGEMVASVRHAAAAGDPTLIWRLIEDSGGVLMWANEVPFLSEEVISFLTRDAIRQWPRVALAHCYVLTLTDRIPEARRLYELAAAGSEGFTRNPTGDVRQLHIELFLVEMTFFLVGYSPINSPELRSALANASAIVQDDNLDPATRALLNFGLCTYENRRARFDAAIELAEKIRRLVSDSQFPYLSLYVDLQLAAMAMAQGQVQEAETYYESSLRTARAHYPDNPISKVLGTAMLRELQFERNRLSLSITAGIPLLETFTSPGNTFASHAPESAIILEVAQYADGTEQALAVLMEMMEYARVTGRQVLVRFLAAQRVALLAAAGRAAEAKRAWRAAGLPSDDADCLDMEALDWREMETIACARLRMYVACEDFEAGRAFAGELLRVVGDNRLVRTEMRVYATLATLEWRAGDKEAACAHLDAFLRRYATTDYARPLLREGEVGSEALEYLFDTQPESPHQPAIRDLLKMIAHDRKKESGVQFTEREMEVLTLLPDLRDKQIAVELGISRDGVSYYLRRLYAKLGVHSRSEAVRQARMVGLLPL